MKGGRSKLPLRLNKQGRNRESAFHPKAYRRASRSADQAPCSSISQNSDALLPVHRTRIVAFGEDYQQPARLKGTRSRGGSPSGYLTDRFGHRQVIHILLSSQAQATKAQSSTRKTKKARKPFQRSGRLFRVSVSCETGASMTRSIGDQPRINRGLTRPESRNSRCFQPPKSQPTYQKCTPVSLETSKAEQLYRTNYF